jgi:hypothetical protein
MDRSRVDHGSRFGDRRDPGHRERDAASAGVSSDDTAGAAPARARFRSVSDRTAYRVALGLVLLPIVIETVRAGRSGWVPARDAAPTVFRAEFALGLHPTLVGMYTDASHWTGIPTYFPGAWQLYWMWVPIKLLGTSWGPLVAMALLNGLWVCLAGWFVQRRLGRRAAVGALTLLAALLYVLTPALSVSPVPMVMVLPPFAAFCFGVWALAAGDDGVLPALALVASFLLLDHLVLVLLVPVLLAFGIASWAVGLIVERRRDRPDWSAKRRTAVRALAGAVVVTVVLWSPALAQQLVGDSGNLGNLVRASGSQPGATMSFWDGLRRWLDLFTPPDFWSRASREHSYLVSQGPPPAPLAVVGAVLVLVSAVTVLAVAACRRRDRPALAAVALAGVSFVAVWVNLERAIGPDGPHPAYVQTSWVVAMFITFALGYGTVRLAPPVLRRAALPAAFGCLLVVTVLNLPHANVPSGVTSASDENIEISRQLDPRLVDALRGRGVVAVGRRGFGGYRFMASSVVALHDAGIPICIDGTPQFEPSPVENCRTRRPDIEIRFDFFDPLHDEIDGWDFVASQSLATPAELREYRRLTRTITAAVDRVEDSGEPLRPTPEFVDLIRQRTGGRLDLGTPEAIAFLNAAPSGRPMHSGAGRRTFASFIDLVIDEAGDAPGVRAFDLPVARSEVLQWARLRKRIQGHSVVVRSRVTG